MGDARSTGYRNDSKKEMRQDALELRRKFAASTDKVHAAECLTSHFIAIFQPQAYTVVSAYWPFRHEVDVRPLLNRLDLIGCTCLLPFIMGSEEPLQFHQWKPGDILEVSRFGVLQPFKHHPNGTPEIVVVPLLAFDSVGYRLGYGGGYYDLTLESLRKRSGILAVGAAYEAQKVDSVPHDQFDQRLDAVVTEVGILQFDRE